MAPQTLSSTVVKHCISLCRSTRTVCGARLGLSEACEARAKPAADGLRRLEAVARASFRFAPRSSLHRWSDSVDLLNGSPIAMSYAPLPSSTVPPPPQASRFSLPLPWSSNSASSSDGSSAYSKPSFLQAITARPLRLLAWSALAVVTILLFAGGMGHGVAAPHVQRIGSYTSEKFWESRQAPSPWRELPQNEGLLEQVDTRLLGLGFRSNADEMYASIVCVSAVIHLKRTPILDSSCLPMCTLLP